MVSYRRRREIFHRIADSMAKGAGNAAKYAEEIAALRQTAGECLILEHLQARMGDALHEVTGGAMAGHGASTEVEGVAVPAEDSSGRVPAPSSLPLAMGEQEALTFNVGVEADSVEQLLSGDVRPVLDIDALPLGQAR